MEYGYGPDDDDAATAAEIINEPPKAEDPEATEPSDYDKSDLETAEELGF